MSMVYNFVRILFDILSLAIFVRVLLSWFNINPFNPFIALLDQITEPVLAPLRRFIPPIGGLDITPIVALFLLQILERILLSFIAGAM
jgi:YggT family protein